MAPRKQTEAFDLTGALMSAWATNHRINVYLVENLPEEAWEAKPPSGKGRGISSMVAHMHNVRLMWLKSATGEDGLPAKLDPAGVSKQQALAALSESTTALERVLSKALRGDGRVRGFKPDAASFLAYLFAHEGHHRGQISMLARQLGYPLTQSAMFGLWEWGTR